MKVFTNSIAKPIFMKREGIFRKPATWFVFVIITILSVFYIYRNFGKANSLVSVDIRMDRALALEKARSLAEGFSLGPDSFKQAVMFGRDSHFQNFVELEAGGLDSFTACIEKGYYEPYYWVVRHFKEKEINEVSFWFTPAGKPYGFSEKIAETEKGAALPESEALKIAEHFAANNWDIDLSPYKLVESSKKEQPGGRIDHTFVYERDDVSAGEGRFRVRLVVSGDKLSEARFFVKIPDEFGRRYEEMRSANDTLSTIASAIIILIYGLIGVGLGMFVIIRRRMLIWQKPAIWGLSIAFASVFLLTLNSLQLSWFSYDTSASQGNFLLREILGGLMSALGLGSIFAISAMAAEGLGRMAFPRHIQFWKIWSNSAGASRQVLGQTIAGYLFAVVILALDVWFYLATKTHFGWWSPADNLSDPNILANQLPWLDSIAISLQAGFWEEALFRAVPLAGVFLLTKKSRFRNFWIVAVLLLQTLVFGAGHANYANQPSYARVVEMVIPFTIMGIIYIFYGLLPAIIAHYTVDVFWISLPLWVSSAPGIWADRVMVVLFLFVPLWIILFFFFRNKKKLNEVPENIRNASWEPLQKNNQEPIEEAPVQQLQKFHFEKWLVPAGVAGLILWFLFTPFSQDAPKLELTKADAIEAAKDTLSEKYRLNFAEWKILTSVADEADTKDIFVWREGGEKMYQSLLHTFLAPPYWEIRFVKTEGKVEDRAEEFSVLATTGKEILMVQHTLPESRPGATLTKEKAQSLADSVLFAAFGEKRELLKEVSVSPEKLENRTDWEFIYADTINYRLKTGQGRILVNIAGDEINQAYKYVYVPEDWAREYKAKNSRVSVFKTIGKVITVGLIIFGLVAGIIGWTRRRFNTRLFVQVSAIMAFAFVVEAINSWSSVIAGYSTELPFSNYKLMVIISLSVSGIFLVLFNGIFVGASSRWMPAGNQGNRYNFLHATGFGLAAAGILASIDSFAPKTGPYWIDIEALNSFSPFIGSLLYEFPEIIFSPALMIVIFSGIHTLSKGYTIRKSVSVFAFLILGLALTSSSAGSPVFWIVSGLLTGGLMLGAYLVFIRYHFEWLPWSFGLFTVFAAIRAAVSAPYPGAVAGSILSAVACAVFFYYWYRRLVIQTAN